MRKPVEINTSARTEKRMKEFADYVYTLNLSHKKMMKLTKKVAILIASVHKDSYEQGLDLGMYMVKWVENDRNEGKGKRK